MRSIGAIIAAITLKVMRTSVSRLVCKGRYILASLTLARKRGEKGRQITAAIKSSNAPTAAAAKVSFDHIKYLATSGC